MIRAWSDKFPAGVLDRLGDAGSAFAYDPEAAPERAISLTMPVRVASWDTRYGLAPIFEMNLPEGALRELLTRRFAKATGRFDDIDLLAIVGRSQIGRLRYSALGTELSEDVPFQSLDELLKARRGGDLFEYLLEKFATHSGLSGVQPKVMVRAVEALEPKRRDRKSPSFLSATHIVKFWEEDEYPDLAANEYFCLNVAQEIGLEVPKFQLSEDGGVLAIERFDYVNGKYLGFEDFCVLNAFRTAEKYSGSYETRLFKRFREFVDPKNYRRASEDLFRLFVLNCAIRNGDAHLKNFGVIYKTIDGPVDLAPIYDLITTTAYIPKDPMALTLNGTTRWPDRQRLIQLGQTRIDLPLKKIEQILEQIADEQSAIIPKIRSYFKHSKFGVGNRMIDAWHEGIRDSLGLAKQIFHPAQEPLPASKPRPIAQSESRILERLRHEGGVLTGTQKALSDELEMPASTLSASIRRLMEKGMIRRQGRMLELLQREV